MTACGPALVLNSDNMEEALELGKCSALHGMNETKKVVTVWHHGNAASKHYKLRSQSGHPVGHCSMHSAVCEFYETGLILTMALFQKSGPEMFIFSFYLNVFLFYI